MNNLKTLSLSNSKTLILDSLYLRVDNSLTNITDLISSTSDLSVSNLTDNSITDLVLTNLCYLTTTDTRLTLTSSGNIFNAPSYGHRFQFNSTDKFFIGEEETNIY